MHRPYFIAEHQFTCGLSLAIGKEAQLARNEIQKVVEFYRVDKDRVRYKEFCDMLENAFTVPDLEKKPTIDVVRPPEGALGRVSTFVLTLLHVIMQASVADPEICPRGPCTSETCSPERRSSFFSLVLTEAAPRASGPPPPGSATGA